MSNETVLQIPSNLDHMEIIERLQFVFNFGLWETEMITISDIIDPIAMYNNIPEIYRRLREARPI